MWEYKQAAVPILGTTEWEYIFEKVSQDLNIIRIARILILKQPDLLSE